MFMCFKVRSFPASFCCFQSFYFERDKRNHSCFLPGGLVSPRAGCRSCHQKSLNFRYLDSCLSELASSLASRSQVSPAPPIHGAPPDPVHPRLPAEWQLVPGKDRSSAEVTEETCGACVRERTAPCAER